MPQTTRGLPVTRSRPEQVFPKLTPVQISQIALQGKTRAVHRGEVLVEQGESNVPFFVVVSGEIEVVRPSGAVETLVTVHGPGQFTGEVTMLSGRKSLFRIRVSEPGEAVELNRQHLLALVQNDPGISDILMRASFYAGPSWWRPAWEMLR
jgi:thioredoxin reductase (NADPH)